MKVEAQLLSKKANYLFNKYNMIKYSKVLLILFLTSCYSRTNKNGQSINGSVQEQKDTLKNVEGKSIDETVHILGKENYMSLIHVTENSNLYEYQSNIYHHIPWPKGKDTIDVRELWWENGNNVIIVWFYQKYNNWIAIDYLTYDKRKTKF
jgi:hypothetical protein